MKFWQTIIQSISESLHADIRYWILTKKIIKIYEGQTVYFAVYQKRGRKYNSFDGKGQEAEDNIQFVYYAFNGTMLIASTYRKKQHYGQLNQNFIQLMNSS